MEDLDNIILETLKDIGCELNSDITSLKQLVDFPDVILKAIILCVQIIDPQGRKFPKTLPRGMSQKVSIGTDVANAVKKLDYKADLSYHQLLYPNESDIRKLFNFLVGRLPKDSPSKLDSANAPAALLNRMIEDELRAQQKLLWTPSQLSWRRYRFVRNWTSIAISSAFLPGPRSTKYKALEAYLRQLQKYITEQPPRPDVVPSVLERNALVSIEAQERAAEQRAAGLGKNLVEVRKQRKANFMNAAAEAFRGALIEKDERKLNEGAEKRRHENLGRIGRIAWLNQDDSAAPAPVTPQAKETEQQLEEKRKAELEALDAELAALQALTQKLAADTERDSQLIRQLEANLRYEEKQAESLQKQYQELVKVMELLPDADNNIAKLEKMKQDALANISKLAQEWEQVRVKLVETFRKLRDDQLHRVDENTPKLEKIKEMRAEIQSLSEDMQQKEEAYNQAMELFERMPKTITRAHYTRRILDIVKNVKKQKVDINKILISTRNLKKEINSINETLDRSFHVVEEMVFADATKDSTAKQAYKQIVGINEAFKKLTENVSDTGAAKNSILEFEAKIETIAERTNALNAGRLLEDLKQIKKENAQLTAQLKAKSAAT